MDLDVAWVILSAILVSTMQAGFCCLESGLVRAKNSINVAIKNLVDFCIACLIYGSIGFALMFGASAFGAVGTRVPAAMVWNASDYAFFLFQLAFCGTVTTIVSGAVAERMSFLGYFIATIILSAFIYPIVGHWVWGGTHFETASGWLRQLQFHDFAGATVVHSVGGWMAFAAILIIGPRLGRFLPSPRAIDGHNLPIAVLGVFLLWFGWFGFNGGSTFAFTEDVPKILVNTAQGGAAGGMAALVSTWIVHRRPRVPLVMNGVVGGLVAVTAGCDFLSPQSVTVVSGVGGLLCTVSSFLLSRYRIDDPVGVVSAHLVCGVWGTLAVALFAEPGTWAVTYSPLQKLGVQALGAGAIAVYAFSVSYGLLWLVNQVLPLRVTPEQERMGLNISEHGASTSIQTLLDSMNVHSLSGDFTQPVEVEPETEASLIADRYNQVLGKMNEMQTELNAGRDRLMSILNSPVFPVAIADRDSGALQFVNERAAEFFGFALQEAGQFREVEFWSDASDRDRFLERLQQEGRVSGFEARMRKANRTQFWSLISGIELTYAQRLCVLLSFSDISERMQRETLLQKLASIDPLTGIYNRRSFFELGEQAIAGAARERRSVSVMMLDIDWFKRINDTFGHAQGDRAIQKVAELATKVLRDGDILGRLGGEEFAVLLQTPVQSAQKIADRLRQRIENNTLDSQDDRIQLTISIGLTDIASKDTLDIALQRADTALYRVKSEGRNRVIVG
ncbi:MAG: ammonium transporter [Cyanobacteria bacterium J06639_1]